MHEDHAESAVGRTGGELFGEYTADFDGLASVQTPAEFVCVGGIVVLKIALRVRGFCDSLFVQPVALLEQEVPGFVAVFNIHVQFWIQAVADQACELADVVFVCEVRNVDPQVLAQRVAQIDADFVGDT